MDLQGQVLQPDEDLKVQMIVTVKFNGKEE